MQSPKQKLNHNKLQTATINNHVGWSNSEERVGEAVHLVESNTDKGGKDWVLHCSTVSTMGSWCPPHGTTRWLTSRAITANNIVHDHHRHQAPTHPPHSPAHHHTESSEHRFHHLLHRQLSYQRRSWRPLKRRLWQRRAVSLRPAQRSFESKWRLLMQRQRR